MLYVTTRSGFRFDSTSKHGSVGWWGGGVGGDGCAGAGLGSCVGAGVGAGAGVGTGFGARVGAFGMGVGMCVG